MYGENTSGHGDAAVIPNEIKGWNWGAFWFTWVWGLFNRSYIALLMFIPILNLIIPFYLGAKGNELAIQKVGTERGDYPTGHTMFIQGTGGIIFIHTDLEKDYSIRTITISPPNDGKEIIIDVVHK